MIKMYLSGQRFLDENRTILNRHPLETVFFEVNAKSISKTNSNDFLVKVERDGKYLLAVHNSHYPMVIFGDDGLCAEFARSAVESKLIFDSVLGSLDTCEAFLEEYDKLADCRHTVNHAMDIMKCDNVLTDVTDGVETPTDGDTEELAFLMTNFSREALGSESDIEELKTGIRARLSDFAIIRSNGKIASFASIKRETEHLACVTDVYTRTEYRCQGLSCRIATFLTKQIIDKGKLAYLFVDKANPISNHLYTKIGYTYAVPQYEIKITRTE